VTVGSRRRWRWRRGALVLPLWVVLAATSGAQGVPSREADLPVTRLQGGTGLAGMQAWHPLPPAHPGDPASLPLTKLDDRSSTADLDGPRRVMLSLARPLPLRDMLLLLVNGTPFSLVTDESVEGTFVGDLRDLSMRQALEAVLFPRGLDYDVQGSLIRVAAHKPATRLFEVDILNERRTWQRAVRGAGSVGAGGAAAEVVTAGTSDPYGELARGVEALLSGTGRVHVDRSAGLVQVTDFADRLDQVGAYLAAVQLRGSRQVRIDAQIFEVTLTDPAATSIDWRVVAAKGGASGGIAGGRGAGMTIRDSPAFMRALGEQGRVAMIGAPHVLAMNNAPAVIRAGTQSVYVDVTSSRDQAGRTGHTVTPASLLEGLTLTVTPQVSASGVVQLSIAPTYTEKTGETKAGRGEIYPVLRVSEADTQVRVDDGDTVVFSGFLQDRSRTRPGTGLASYFGAQSHDIVKSELVILLTPHVVTPGAGSAANAR
jgi:type II secretory pathway component HofQ